MTSFQNAKGTRRLRRWLIRVVTMHRGLLTLLTATLSIVITLVLLNFTGPTEKIEQLLPHQYAIGDVQFERVMSEMLGPSVVGGNRIELLRNERRKHSRTWVQRRSIDG